MQFPLHLPCASMWLSLRTSMWLSFDCIEVVDNRIVASVSANSIGSLAVSALAGICNAVCYYLSSRGLGRTRMLHKDVMAESGRFCWLAESVASLQTGFRSAWFTVYLGNQGSWLDYLGRQGEMKDRTLSIVSGRPQLAAM
jgi:hypothetical protein